MHLKKLIKYGFMTIFLFGNAMAMTDHKDEDKVLVIGARPWDVNIAEYSCLKTAHFVDFMASDGPNPLPDQFHHLDIDNEGKNGAANFSVFATTNHEKFKTIVLDWATYQHIHRDNAWADFATLLGQRGNLIVPVTSQSLLTGESQSHEKAQKIKDKLTHLFGKVNIISYEDMPQDTGFDLLRRPSLESDRLEYGILPMKPAILVAAKQIAAEKNALETEVKISNNNSKDELIRTSAPKKVENNSFLQESTEATSVRKSYREIKFPDLTKIQEQLHTNWSTVASETHDLFNIQNPLSLGIGCGFDNAPDFNLRWIGVSNSKVTNNLYRLFGFLEVNFSNNNKIVLALKHANTQSYPYIIEGATKTENTDVYKISEPTQLKVWASQPIKN